MKVRFIAFLLVGFLLQSNFLLAQDSIPVLQNKNEERLLKFQDYFFKALAQKAIFNYRVAIQNLEKCNELQPENMAVLFELSKNYLMMKRFLEAETYGQQALALSTKNYWILSHLSKLYVASRNLNKAIVVQEKLVLLNPKEKEKLVYLYFQTNQKAKANSLLIELEKSNLISKNLLNFKRRFLKGVVVKKEENTSNDLTSLMRQFDQNKSFVTLRKILTLSANKDVEILFKYSEKGLELFPAQAYVYLMHAKALNMQKKFSEATSHLNNGVDFVIDDNTLKANFYDELSKSYFGLGNEKEAIKNKNKALLLRNK